jgi:pimeloyl-ACP methyl ester carboxylesterase
VSKSTDVEIKVVDAGSQVTGIAEAGEGQPVLLLHGSGPGVSGLANWRLTLPGLASAGFRAIAPDQLGFGRTVPPDDHRYSLESWVDHAIDLLDSLGLERVHLIGNSFGGAVALRLAANHPERVDRLVLMGAAGVPFPITAGLDLAWGYEPSVERMAEIIELMSYDSSGFGRELIQQRYEASIENGADERFAAMFPAPRQRWVDALSTSYESIARITSPTLVIHGRDDRVVPIQNSMTLLQLLPDVRAHIFGQCGHWTQIEHAAEFNDLVASFFHETKDAAARGA